MTRGGRGDAVDRFYSRWAGMYDLLARRTPGIGRIRRQSVDALDLDSGDAVIEMGCGTGANLPILEDRVGAEGRVVGLDLASGVLRRARRRTRESDSIAVIRGDATRPPIRRADAILATFVVGMLDDPGEVVSDWIDLLEPDGRIVLLNARRSPHPAATPLNLAFRGFVRLAAPGKRASLDSPARDLEAKVADARATLAEECEAVRTASLAGGYLTLVSGQKSG